MNARIIMVLASVMGVRSWKRPFSSLPPPCPLWFLPYTFGKSLLSVPNTHKNRKKSFGYFWNAQGVRRKKKSRRKALPKDLLAAAAAAAAATQVKNVGKVSVVMTLKFLFSESFLSDLLNICNGKLIMRLPGEEMSDVAWVFEIWSVPDGVR